ncbi:MAG: radical SAM protein [Paludibacteraceae bacterium]|nr:radical SAM protein [Paludibacteraceae bacterium]
MIELLSIDLSNYCSKQCPFCYNHSSRDGNTLWKPQEVIAFATDCIQSGGVKAISLGGGEPFEYEGIFAVIEALYPLCYLSVTSNGLPLEDDKVWERLANCKPDKIHVTIHRPDNPAEIERVETLLARIAGIGIKPGVNLLVGKDNLENARNAYKRLLKNLTSEQIILVPQRYANTPSAKELATVAGGKPFQSPSCLLRCTRPQNFCSVSWDKKVNSCSFAKWKEPLETPDYNGLRTALGKISWVNGSCLL